MDLFEKVFTRVMAVLIVALPLMAFVFLLVSTFRLAVGGHPFNGGN